MAEKETLYCPQGDHIWIDVRTDPLVCPLHGQVEQPKKRSKIVKVSPPRDKKTGVSTIEQSATQHLYCEAGKHDWSRPAQRGAKPKNCPDHQPQVEKASEGRTRSSREANATGKPKIMTPEEIRAQYPYVDSESMRIFTFVHNETNRPDWPGWRENEDVRLLMESYKSRLRHVARGRVVEPELPV